jgi:hypothetical protein
MPKATTIIGWGQRLGALGVGVLAVVLCINVYTVQKKADAAVAASWSLDGTPCPTVDAATYAGSWGKPQVTAFGDVKFGYRVGHMVCTHRPNAKGGGEHGVCDFTGPVMLGVTSPTSTAYFAPTGMSAVRASVVDGQARCVLIPPFRMQDRK